MIKFFKEVVSILKGVLTITLCLSLTIGVALFIFFDGTFEFLDYFYKKDEPRIATKTQVSTPTPTPSPISSPSPTPQPTTAPKAQNTVSNTQTTPTSTYDDGFSWAKAIGADNCNTCSQFEQSHGSEFVRGCRDAIGCRNDRITPQTNNNSASQQSKNHVCCEGHGGFLRCTPLYHWECNDGYFDVECFCEYVAPTPVPTSNPTSEPVTINIPSLPPLDTPNINLPETVQTTEPIEDQGCIVACEANKDNFTSSAEYRACRASCKH